MADNKVNDDSPKPPTQKNGRPVQISLTRDDQHVTLTFDQVTNRVGLRAHAARQLGNALLAAARDLQNESGSIIVANKPGIIKR